VNAEDFYRWLTHMPAVACSSLSQRCQWLLRYGKPNQLKCIFKSNSGSVFLASVAACDKTPQHW